MPRKFQKLVRKLQVLVRRKTPYEDLLLSKCYCLRLVHACVGGPAAPLGRATVDRRWCATVGGHRVCDGGGTAARPGHSAVNGCGLCDGGGPGRAGGSAVPQAWAVHRRWAGCSGPRRRQWASPGRGRAALAGGHSAGARRHRRAWARVRRGPAAPLGRAAVDRRWCATVAGRLPCLTSPPLTGVWSSEGWVISSRN